MFTKNMKSILIITLLFVMSFVSIVLYADCEMMAMIAKRGNYISWLDSETGTYNDPYDYFQFMRSHSGQYSQNDGYGVIYYPDDGTMYFDETDYYNENNQAWYKTNRDFYGDWHLDYTWYGDNEDHWKWNYYEPLGLNNIIEATIMDNNTRASIVLGHDRNTTGTTYGNHPFRIVYTDPITQDTTYYTFEHNGGVVSYKDEFYTITNTLHTNWFVTHPSNWVGVNNPNQLYTWIDSELYFHYIVANIEDPYEANGDVIQGIYNALSNPEIDLIESNVNANFILSDGENIYAYRCTDNTDYDISYTVHEDFISITSEIIGTSLIPDDLAIISPYGDIEIINLVDPLEFKSGIIAQSTTWNSNILITDDITVPVGVTLYIDSEATFVSHSTFTVNGTVNLQDDSNFELNHASQVLVENDGLFFLDWGSTILGSTPTTVEATPPGYPVGGEAQIPGDRIIAKNGGKITTKTKIQYDEYVLSHGEEPSTINITSSSGIQWDGISIQNPSDEDDFWFVNCDILGIRKLSIENISETETIANLKLYQTDFHDAGQVVVRDGHKLSIQGIEGDLCHFYNTPAYPIIAYVSQVDLSYIHIGGIEEEDGLENGGGIYLYGTAGDGSTINNCDIMYNDCSGVRLDGAYLEFHHNNIKFNGNFGIIAFPLTLFNSQYLHKQFDYINIHDNGYAEYVGWQSTFNMGIDRTDIDVVDTDDGFLLMNLNWDGEIEVDIRGTYPSITDDDLPYLFPTDPDAWDFGGGGITPEEEMLYAAANDMGNGNYTTAEQTLQQLISDYPLTKEAGTAVYYLYHLENLTAQDFSGLREYLENIIPPNNSSLEIAIKKIITKTYMKDKDYLIAIDLLETVIANSQIPDEVILAMIDQGYCYMELTEEGERGLPANCTIKTATLDEYQAKVRELESQFSFYPEELDPNTTPVVEDILSVTNFPNPFNPTTTISFDLASESNVNITVYNVKGQKVKQLVSDQFIAGQHSIEWSGKDTNNKSVSSGIYFYKISAGKSTSMRKMLLLK